MEDHPPLISHYKGTTIISFVCIFVIFSYAFKRLLVLILDSPVLDFLGSIVLTMDLHYNLVLKSMMQWRDFVQSELRSLEA